ncbi:Growth hormone-regulated TBC protein 1 [Mactra antiquata]
MSSGLVQNDVDGYGFQRPSNFNHGEYDAFMAEYLPVMTRRALRWEKVIGNASRINKSRTVKRFCRKGIPASLRPMVWMSITGADVRMESNPHLYQQMLSANHDRELTETIEMDIHRTFPDNAYFSNPNDNKCLRKPLYNILISIGHRNKTIAYCQGMNFIAGLMLLIMKDEDKYEEKVFWLMDTLINNILPDYYHPDMHAIQVDQELLGELVKWKYPAIHTHLDHLGLQWCLIGMKWFICIFADVLPIDTVLRVWDCLFSEGPKILLRVALAIVCRNQEKILKCKNFSEVTDLFQEAVVGSDSLHCHSFLKCMFEELGSLPMARVNRVREEVKTRV